MTVYDNQVSLLSEINSTLSVLDQIKSLSNILSDINFDSHGEEDEDENNDNETEEAKTVLREILELCDEANEHLKASQQHSEMIRAMLGVSNLFLSAISMGLPPNVAMRISEVPSDTWQIRNIITELKAIDVDIADFDLKKAKQQLSNVWITTALGDQGELEVLKSLLDEGHEMEEIAIKPHLGKKRPDFYIEDTSLICDSKAYKNIHNVSDLRKVVQTYSELLPNGGEVRLYFPKDTYERSAKELLVKLGSQDLNGVKVSVFSMDKTHSELGDSLKFLYSYLPYI